MKTSRLLLSAATAAVLVSVTAAEALRTTTTQPATKPATTKSTAAKPVAKRPAPPAAVSQRDGTLSYTTTDRGDRVPDFSFAGYAAGERPIPTVPAKLVARAPAGDNTLALQAAIDEAGRLPVDTGGFRGAVLIPPGQYDLTGSLVLGVSGVVLRGSGTGDGGTTLHATGQDRRTVIQIKGAPRPAIGAEQTVTDAYVPVNATKISVADASGFKAGDSVVLRRPSTPDWIVALHMDDLGGDRNGPSWRPGSRDIVFDRTVAAVDGNTLTLDAPLTIALDADFGGATVAESEWPGRVVNSGVENLRIVSACDEKSNPKDEDHAWFGVGIENARDVWVRQVTCENLTGSAVAAWESSSRVTVEDCKNLHPVGEIGGLRRNAFFTDGQQVLMQRLHSEEGFHDLAVGFAAAGPNAFVQCESKSSHGESGPIDSAACGTLMDRCRIDGQPLSLRNRTYLGQGVGWASFNGMMWNSTAPLIDCERPPTAQNWAFGTSGEFSGDGAFNASNDDVNPDSLYYAQLAARVGRDQAAPRAQLNLPGLQGSRAPTLEDTVKIIARSYQPRVTMADWIDQAARRNPIPTDPAGLNAAAEAVTLADTTTVTPGLSISGGWLTWADAAATGRAIGVPWWSGGVRPADLTKTQPAITRFVPGRTGTGLTDDLATLAETMQKNGQVSVFQHPPLWYERRRDDHERVQRIDGDVVAPFYETPWARSGVGTASDGLSKFDVTKPNPWYYDRLKKFAALGREHGIVMFTGLYMQHNVLEAGAHYFDAPWRPANNINPVGIPEPVFFAGDKLIYVAEQFYDVTNPERAALHRSYMRTALDQLGDQPNVIFFLSEEYTGPLAFNQFWLDTVADWEKETGKKPLIALYATKDVTDAILADPKRAGVVSVIYNRFNNEGDAGFWYQADGTLYAPQGGKNLSPRQWSRLIKPKMADAAGVYRAVSEYRTKYPDKPFVYDGPENFGWAELMGGGSLAPVKLDPALAAALPKMKPMPAADGVWTLSDGAADTLAYGPAARLNDVVAKHGGAATSRVDLSTGALSDWKNESADRVAAVWIRQAKAR